MSRTVKSAYDPSKALRLDGERIDPFITISRPSSLSRR